MKARFSLQEIRSHASDILNRFDPPRESLEALLALAMRVAGYDPYPGLAAVDVDLDIARIAEQVQYVLREEPPPAEMRYLLVGGYGFCESPTARPIYACWLSGQSELNQDDLEAMEDPVYSVYRYQIQSAFLDGVMQCDHDDHDHDDETKELALCAVLDPATVVLFHAAIERLGLPYTVVVGGDDNPNPYIVVQESGHVETEAG